MSRRDVDPDLRQELEAIAETAGCELLHVEFKAGVLRLVIDHPDGVTHGHCEQVSREASPLLDVEDFGSRHYVLEVSSPGLDRQLYRPRDYERFLGRAVRVTFADPATGGRQTISGRLQAFDATAGGTATVTARDAGGEHAIPLAAIKVAKLEIEL